MTQPAPNPHESNGIEYGHVFAQFTEGTADTSLDLDPYPDERPVTGSVSFRPKFSGQAAVATLRVPGTPRSRGLVVTEVEYKIVNSRLVDLQDREGVWLIVRVGDIPVHWQATVVLRDRSNRVVLQTAYLLGDESLVAELDGTRTVNLPDLIPNPSLLSPSEVAAILSAQSSMDRALVVAGELEEAMPEISAAGQYASDAQDAATLAGQYASDAQDAATLAGQEADRAAGLAGAQDAVVADHVATEGRQTQTAVDGRIAHWQDTVGNATYGWRGVGSVPPTALTSTTLVDKGTTPAAIENFGGYLWGAYGSEVHRSSDNGTTWQKWATAPSGSVQRVRPTSDGGAVVMTNMAVYKVANWATAPVFSAAKVTANGQAQFMRFQLDGDGTKFVCAQYGPGLGQPRVDSRYGHISLDAGETWTQAWDSVALFGQSEADASHIHGVCYDKWEDCFYIAEGHVTNAGLYRSDDDGATWYQPPGLKITSAPTSITATDDGLVCGSDDEKAGVLGVPRSPDPQKMTFRHIARWAVDWDGVLGFAQQAVRDERTGIVYIAFQSGVTGVAPIIAGGTATAATILYTYPGAITNNISQFQSIALGADGTLFSSTLINGTTREIFTGHIANRAQAFTGDPGAVRGGTSVKNTSTSVGTLATTGGAFHSIAVGTGSSTASATQDATAVGYHATVTGSYGTALGSGASSVQSSVGVGASAAAAFAQTVVLGMNAGASNSAAVAIGYGAKAANASVVIGTTSDLSATANATAIGHGVKGGSYGTVVGRSADGSAGADVTLVGAMASATGANATAIGRSTITALQATCVGAYAEASATYSTALGQGAKATASYSVALGRATTADQQWTVAIGTRGLTALNVTSTPATVTGGGVIYVENGALKYKGSSGTVTQLGAA